MQVCKTLKTREKVQNFDLLAKKVYLESQKSVGRVASSIRDVSFYKKKFNRCVVCTLHQKEMKFSSFYFIIYKNSILLSYEMHTGRMMVERM